MEEHGDSAMEYGESESTLSHFSPELVIESSSIQTMIHSNIQTKVLLNISCRVKQPAACFVLISFLAYSSTLNI
jgi:hypothetical protein